MITAQTLDANDLPIWFGVLTEDQRGEVRALLEEHGIDPCETRSVTYDVIDAPLLRVREYVRDADGRVPVDGDGPATAVRELALREPLPVWWRPEVTGCR